MHLRSKLILEICQKVGSLDGKTEQSRLKVPTLPPFSQRGKKEKEKLHLLKNKKR